jgi:hypothetical protein
MQAEVDQSGRIEQTNRPTVLAIANGVQYSVRISAREKQRLLATLKQSKPDWSTAFINILVFSTFLYLLLKGQVQKLTLVTIDQEFPGHEPLIKDRVMTLCRRQGIEVQKEQLTFREIGKKSPAHKLAWQVYNKLVKPGQTVSAEDVLAEFRT